MTDNAKQFDIISNSEGSQINNFIDKLLDSNDTAYVFYDNVWMPYEEYLKIISTIKNPKTLYKELLEKTLSDYMHKIDISKLSIDK
jgi:hypothetical protein